MFSRNIFISTENFKMLRVFAIVLLTLSIIANVCANACGHDNCETTIDIPLITKLNAPLKAELDITSLTSQLKELIGKEVKQAVSNAVNDLVENITDMRFQIAVDRLQNSSNIAMSTFRTEIEGKSKMIIYICLSYFNSFIFLAYSIVNTSVIMVVSRL